MVNPAINNCNPDSRKFLTGLEWMCNYPAMARFSEIVGALKQQLMQDGKRVAEINQEINKLRSAYNQFRDLSTEVKTRSSRMLTTRALLGKMVDAKEVIDAFDDEITTLEATDDLHGHLNLWKAMREILRQTSWIQVQELHAVLVLLDVKASRQAIESAITTHRKIFRIKKRGREKFITLAE